GSFRPEPSGAPPGAAPAPRCTPRHALPYPPRGAVATLGQVHAIRVDKDNESGDTSREPSDMSWARVHSAQQEPAAPSYCCDGAAVRSSARLVNPDAAPLV